MSGLGNKKVMAANIQRYMSEHNKTRADVCNDLGFKYSTFSEWVTGTKYPRIDKIEMLANYFGIQKSDLIEEAAPKDPINSYPVGSFVRIPVIGRVLAGVGGIAEVDFLGYDFATDITNAEEYRYLEVKGDSMMPRIEPGDRALVHLQSDVDSGALAVVIVNGEEGLIKKVVKHDDAISLVSFNPYYPERIFRGEEMNNIRIWGKVKEIKRAY